MANACHETKMSKFCKQTPKILITNSIIIDGGVTIKENDPFRFSLLLQIFDESVIQKRKTYSVFCQQFIQSSAHVKSKENPISFSSSFFGKDNPTENLSLKKQYLGNNYLKIVDFS